jgi:CheY-like chemotaxis protein
VEVDLRLDPNLPAIEADPVQLQQVIMNIIINAAEAIPDGTPGAVTVITRREQVVEAVRTADGHDDGELAPGPYISFEVTDTGCGMDEETRARIFDPFFTTKFTGRGLGLAAVLGIVRGHKGSIQVTSTPGKGATFRVLLPALETAQERKAVAPQQLPSVASRGNGVILVVDDEQFVRNLAKYALERCGYEVLLAENGARGLDIFREQADRITCVVLDLTMPVMSGEETLVRMKAERNHIPIILSSGFNEAQAVRQFQGKGLAGFLQKPYRAAGLVESIGRVLSRSESTSAS